jgi:hypothetical protein
MTTNWDALCTPTTSEYGRNFRYFLKREEMELVVAPETLANRSTFLELYSFVCRPPKVLWMTPQVLVASQNFPGVGDLQQVLRIGQLFRGGDGQLQRTSMGFSVFAYLPHAQVFDTCDFLTHLFAESDMSDVFLEGINVGTIVTSGVDRRLAVSQQTLLRFVMRDSLQLLVLHHFELDDQHLNALRSAHPNLQLELGMCSVASGAEAAFIDCIQSIQCPTELSHCVIDSGVLAEALSGETNVKKLALCSSASSLDDDDEPLATIVRSLERNAGLVELDLGSTRVSDENLTLLCESLVNHTTLTTLILASNNEAINIISEKSRQTFWLQAIIQLLQVNTVLHTIRLPDSLVNTNTNTTATTTTTAAATVTTTTDIYQQEIVPRLDMNQFRPYFLAIKSTSDTVLRSKLLCRALSLPMVQSSAILVFTLLSDNVQVLNTASE